MISSIDWLVETFKLTNVDLSHHKLIIEQAKEMHRQEIIRAAADHCYPTCEVATIDAEQYYNQTFKSE